MFNDATHKKEPNSLCSVFSQQLQIPSCDICNMLHTRCQVLYILVRKPEMSVLITVPPQYWKIGTF